MESMRRLTLPVAALVLVLSACSAPPEAAASMPPVPEAPAGWASSASFGGVGGNGMTSIAINLTDGAVAVSAACAGSGTLVVMLSAQLLVDGDPVAATSVAFPCGEGVAESASRLELANAPVGDITASAFVIEGGGTIRHAAYNVSLEQTSPTEVAIGGVRPEITRADLAAARVDMLGGLLEPCWLPDGFQLAHIAYTGLGPPSTDLWYDGGDLYLHMWQTYLRPSELGSEDPVALGEPTSIGDDIEWRANPLAHRQIGRAGVVEYSARLPDGRTVSIDTDVSGDDIERLLNSLCVRIRAGETP